MEKDKDIYVAINLEEYKKNKARILESQASVLRIIKNLQNLRKTKQAFNYQRLKLQKVFAISLEHLEVLEDELPHPTLPKSIQQDDSIHVSHFNEDEERSIDEELMQIHEKLRVLNC